MMLTYDSMLYHTIIVHLFRPMLAVEFKSSNIYPREICIDAANSVSRLFRIYQSLYDLRKAHLAIPYILFSVCIVHLLYSTDKNTTRQNLVDGLQGLDDLHECHFLAAKSFRIIHTLAKTWGLPWPEELRESNLILKGEPDTLPMGTVSPATAPSLVAPNTTAIDGSSIGPNMPCPIGGPHRRQSLSMFGQGRLHLATHPAPPRPNSVVPSQHYQSPLASHTPTQPTFNTPISPSSYQYPQSIPSVPANVSTTSAPPTRNASDNIFWNSIPGMPGPTLPRMNYQQIGPMGTGGVLQSTDPSDQLRRDSFKIEEDWRPEPSNGFSPNGTGHVFGIHNDQSGVSYVRRGSGYVPEAGVTYQHPPHDGRHGHNPHVYDPSWWPTANGNPTHLN